MPLRLRGTKYFDKETNLHYNYFRDYDPTALCGSHRLMRVGPAQPADLKR